MCDFRPNYTISNLTERYFAGSLPVTVAFSPVTVSGSPVTVA